jgi:uncharacterized protein
MRKEEDEEAVDAASGGGKPRFLVDAMLANVARDLRLLGYDAEYLADVDDAVLLRRAQAESRVLVTRDRRLAARASGIRCILLTENVPSRQVRELLERTRLASTARPYTRCTVCNHPLEELPAEDARDRVPDHVAHTVRKFFQCAACGRVYWRGTHARGLEHRLRRMLGKGGAD